MDVVEQLGALALASRLKRLAERLSRDVSRIYDEHQLDFHARWFPLMYLLSKKSSLAITEIATELGLTHPAVNQIAGQMSRHGLLTVSGDKTDGRRRLLSLNAKGRATARKVQPLWDVIRQANEDLLRESGGNFLKQLGAIEEALDRSEMYDRVNAEFGRTEKKVRIRKSTGNRRK